MTVGEFADTHPKGVYLLRIPAHLTCIIDGTCYDIFDCRFDGEITDAWEVE